MANAYRIKQVTGRETDVKDAEWIADLLRHGLPRGSFVPAPDQRHLRHLTRHRTHLVDERARATNCMQALLKDANVKLAAVVTDVRGASARAIPEALVAGESDPSTLAELARGRLRAKREGLMRADVGRVAAHGAVLFAEHLSQLDDLQEAVDRVSAEIERRLRDEQAALDLLDAVRGNGRRVAETLVAELGADLSRFPSAEPAGLGPAGRDVNRAVRDDPGVAVLLVPDAAARAEHGAVDRARPAAARPRVDQPD